MNWDAIAAIGEVSGALGVIISLLYLAVQIRNSNRNYKIESARSVMSNFHGNSWDLAKDPELRRIMSAALNDYSSMSPEDSTAFDFFMWRYVGNAADALQLRNLELLDEESFDIIMKSLILTIRSIPGWWEAESKSHIVPPSLLEYINAKLAETVDESWGTQHANWMGVRGNQLTLRVPSEVQHPISQTG